MPELTREEKLKIFEKLPERLQDFLCSEDTGAFLLYLGNKYKLTDEKVSALSKLVADIIFKITPITSLAQEIVNKVIPDQYVAMAIAQELNNELLTPILIPAPTISAVPVTSAPIPATPPAPIALSTPMAPPRPVYQPVAPQTQQAIPTVLPKPALVAPTPKTDQYREPASGAPEIVDLRKTPPEQTPTPKVGAPTPPSAGVGVLPMAAAPIPPMVNKVELPRPLTFTKPVPTRSERAVGTPTPAERGVGVEPIKPSLPLIEANPHLEEVKIPEPPKLPVTKPVETIKPSDEGPQFIIRPSGLAPTDLPHDVLDLRKDKGEF